MKQEAYQGSNPLEIPDESIKARPVSAIEMPLGQRVPERQEHQTTRQITVYEAYGAFADWNDVARKHPWG